MIEKKNIIRRRGLPVAIKHELREKSGNKCAFPNCDAELVSNQGRLLGEICSIIPLHKHGPRAIAEISEEELYSIDNFIFLCPNHHRLIDLEPETYTVKYLRELKEKHESSLLQNQTVIHKEIEIPEGLSIEEIISFWNENKNNKSEEFWQQMLSNHPQIISCIYPNPIMKIGEKAYFGGKGLNNKGGNIGDFVFKNKKIGSVVIVEIKTPHTALLGSKYRQNSYSISKELSGAIVQTLNYRMEVQRDFHRLKYESDEDFEVIEPVCLVIAGNLDEVNFDGKKLRSFELFRNSVNNTLIITFDELFDKLQDINDLTKNSH